MKHFTAMTGVFTVMAATSAQSAPPAPVEQKDVQCLLLYAVSAGAAKDDNSRERAQLGTMYYFAKIRTEAPDLDVVEALRDVGARLQNNPETQKIAQNCDSEFHAVSEQLSDVGEKLRANP
jgi:hypothetical protein